MARPKKWRKVCCLPNCNKFGPLLNENPKNKTIVMTVDEYETIRLIDLENFNQEECARQMGIARSTVQGIYMQARKKMAEALVNGKNLSIKDGEYKLCDGRNLICAKHKKHNCHKYNQKKEQKIV